MAYLMADMAAGSDAALRMQQNMAAAPYVEQQQANFMQEQALKLQHQAQINDATRMKNLMAGSEYQASEEAKTKLKALSQTPEWKAADDTKRLSLVATAALEAGQVEEGTKLLDHAALAETKQAAAALKKVDAQARQLRGVSDTINTIPEEQLDSFFNSLPAGSMDNVISAVGKENWDRMGPSQKKEVIKRLSETSQERLESQKEASREKIAAQLAESRKEIERLKGQIKLSLKGTKSAGQTGTKEDVRLTDMFLKAQARSEGTFKARSKELHKELDEADHEYKTLKATTPPWHEAVSGTQASALKKAQQRRQLAQAAVDDMDVEMLSKDLEIAQTLPASPTKTRIMDQLRLAVTAARAKQNNAPPPAPKADTSNKYTPEQQAIVDKAQDAINKGADPEQVKARLKKAGIPGY